MSGTGSHRKFLSRFESRSEKSHLFGRGSHHDKHSDPVAPPHESNASTPAEFYGLFGGRDKPVDSHEEQKVKALRKRIMDTKGVLIKDAPILFALHSNFSHGDENKAFDLLLAMSNASEGLVSEFDPTVKLLGAENRQGVTCYLDSVLFAMFSRLDTFEAILYNTFNNIGLCRLGLLLRMWVNLLRSGKLVTVDITKMIQAALAECGWADAATLSQQDASEAFTFITEKLELPLLTLKMDIYHTGKEDANDDHKFINERLLEVAIPQDPSGEKRIITLEDCLEEYFNNRIEVRRYLERRSTINSTRNIEPSAKSAAIHIESIEVESESSPVTPFSSSPSRPQFRHRAPSIIQERYVPDRSESGFSTLTNVDSKGRSRQGSIRKEVMMPAWQFFSLIPWYTDNVPSNDAQVAAHFSSKRPVLGLCLKRYSMTAKGKAIRLNTRVDIPVEIGLPHFIQDDHMEDDGPLYGNFKLLLQSVVCHRGNSVDSGHYISLVRGSAMTDGAAPELAQDTKHWMRFDDLAAQRVTLVDVEKALKDETPYLLFYQIVPIAEPPVQKGDTGPLSAYPASVTDDSASAVHSLASLELQSSRGEPNPASASGYDLFPADDARGQFPVLETRRPSVAFTEPIFAVNPADGPDNERSTDQTLSRPHSPSGGQSNSSSRPQSRAGEGLTRTLSRLSGIMNKEAAFAEVHRDPEIHVREVSNSVSTMDSRPIVGTKNLVHKPQKTDKSRARLSKGAPPGKSKHERPDRECILM